VLFLLAGTAMGSDALATESSRASTPTKASLSDRFRRQGPYVSKLGDKVVVNRGGTEGKSDLKAGDAVNVSYSKGLATWTAKYILVQEGDSKTGSWHKAVSRVMTADKKEIVCTDAQRRIASMTMGDAKVRMCKKEAKEAKVEDITIGDRVLMILQTAGEKKTLQTLMFERKE